MITLRHQHRHPPHDPDSGQSSRLLVNFFAQPSESSQAVTISLSSHRETGETGAAGQDAREQGTAHALRSPGYRRACVLL